jgi:hypothetical protein
MGGKMRKHSIRVLPVDRVVVDLPRRFETRPHHLPAAEVAGAAQQH